MRLPMIALASGLAVLSGPSIGHTQSATSLLIKANHRQLCRTVGERKFVDKGVLAVKLVDPLGIPLERECRRYRCGAVACAVCHLRRFL